MVNILEAISPSERSNSQEDNNKNDNYTGPYFIQNIQHETQTYVM